MKNEIQKRIKKEILDNNFRGIILASMRLGKCRVILEAVKEDSDGLIQPDILILYPNIDIKKSWEEECDKIDYHPNITYCTFASIEKMREKKFNYIICDESHNLGYENQLPIAGIISKHNKKIIFASGTYSGDTLKEIQAVTNLKLIVNYPVEEAIKDGIVSDFNIYIHNYILDPITNYEFGKIKKWHTTEKKECNRLSNRILNSYGEEKKFAALNRMRFINSSNSLFKAVNTWIKNNKDERFLLFSSDEKTAMKYNLPMFNSKSINDGVLQQFQREEINQLCLIKKGSVGVTYHNLKNILITAINSNGENLLQQIGRSLLTDTDDSNIHIFVSTEEFQQNWLKKALQGIEKNKIHYI